MAALLNIDIKYIKTSIYSSQINTQKRLVKREDISELSMIKTFLKNPHLIDTLLDVVGHDVFVTHQEEFQALLRGDKENPYLIEVDIRDDIKPLTEEELKNHLIKLLMIKNRQQLQKIKLDKTLDFEKKSFMIRKINENIKKLKRGELVGYEMFSTF